jgi:8-oxo-dGTP pyrophosphatase MutT (NUDIX family)
MNPDRPNPKWKLPGGHKEQGETPLETAMRENQGETGLRLPREAFTEITSGHELRKRPTEHWSLLFLVHVPLDDVRLLHEHDTGNEGEVVRYFTLAELEIEIHNGTILLAHLYKLQAVSPYVTA